MRLVLKNGERVVHIPEVRGRFERGGAVLKPFLLVMRQKYVGEGWTQWGAHGNTVFLMIIGTIKNEQRIRCDQS